MRLVDDRFLSGFRRIDIAAMRSLRILQMILQLLLFLRDNADPVNQFSNIRLNRIDHFLKHIEAFDLILNQRIALPISAQIDTFPQHIHMIQMFHPLIIDHAQHDNLLQLAHNRLGIFLFPGGITFLGNLHQRFLKLVAAHSLQIFLFQPAFRCIDCLRILDQPVQRPFFRIQFFTCILVHFRRNNLMHHIHDIIPQMIAHEHLAALRINNLTLLIHNIVIFQHILTHIKIARFHFLLRMFNGPRNEFMLNRFILFHAQLIHDRCNIISSEQAQQIILQRQIKPRRPRITLAPSTAAQLIVDTARLMPLGAKNAQTTELRDAFTQHNIRTAPSHIRGNRHRIQLPGIFNDLGFLLMELCIQHTMRNPSFIQQAAEFLRLSDGSRAYKNRLPGRVNFFYGIGHRLVFSPFRLINDIRIILTDHRFIRRHHDDRQLIDLEELILLRLRRARHAGQFLIHTKIILERDCRQCLRLPLNLHAFFGFNRLMQAIGITAAHHQPAGEFINNDDFPVAHYIIAVALHEGLSPKRCRKAMRHLNVLRRIEVFHPDGLFYLQHRFVAWRHRLLLLIQLIVDILLQRSHCFGHNCIHIRGFCARSGYDQRRSGFIHENTIYLVDDCIVQIPLYHLLRRNNHIVTQIVKTIFIVRTKRYITAIGKFALRKIHIMRNEPHRKSEKMVQMPHPLTIALRQVIIDRDHVNALARQRI